MTENTETAAGSFRAARIDLDAVRRNLGAVRAFVGRDVATAPRVMAVVKANAYGHGALAVAEAAQAAGVDWLGVADIAEALELRRHGITAPILAWLHSPDADFAAAIAAGVSVGVSSPEQLRQVTDAAARLARTASVQLKLDTGLSRNGFPEADWTGAFAVARAAEIAGAISVDGLFSHLSNASPEADAAQCAQFDIGIAAARQAGLAPTLLHIAATAAALTEPAARYTMVRIGIGVYGLSPWGDGLPEGLELTPVMTLAARVAAVRRVVAGTAASYDYTWRAERDTTLALVPLGYADGIPRQASGRASVAINGVQYPVVGRVAMDQFIVDVGDTPVQVGDEVVLFGDPRSGVPSAEDWAEAAGTINYEIVTRIGQRVPRSAR
ncbi:alanine racemase [Microterricola viridarii]|uniref:Alanine racemase n=1 Tax=Microterricola viridarii TaxID=412690 RepID=A0A0Y0PCE1_9MICO|nr:alanine racemase [Microterricola viridarii]AMB60262.1 alanine racemase [Microterricola viridarii]